MNPLLLYFLIEAIKRVKQNILRKLRLGVMKKNFVLLFH